MDFDTPMDRAGPDDGSELRSRARSFCVRQPDSSKGYGVSKLHVSSSEVRRTVIAFSVSPSRRLREVCSSHRHHMEFQLRRYVW
jgi:hypothetical protein